MRHIDVSTQVAQEVVGLSQHKCERMCGMFIRYEYIRRTLGAMIGREDSIERPIVANVIRRVKMCGVLSLRVVDRGRPKCLEGRGDRDLPSVSGVRASGTYYCR